MKTYRERRKYYVVNPRKRTFLGDHIENELENSDFGNNEEIVADDENAENRDNEGMTADGRNTENESGSLDSSLFDIENDDTSKSFDEVSIDCDGNSNDDDKNNEIYDGCRIKMDIFIGLLIKIKMRGQISDYTMEDLLGLINMLLPEKNRLPKTMRGLRSLMRNMCTDMDRIYSQVKEEKVFRNVGGKDVVVGRMLVFPSNDIINAIVKWNSKHLFKQYDEEVKELTVQLHTDGGQLSKSSEISVWPLTGIMMDLPPRLRMSFNNVIVFSIWLSGNQLLFEEMC